MYVKTAEWKTRNDAGKIFEEKEEYSQFNTILQTESGRKQFFSPIFNKNIQLLILSQADETKNKNKIV